MNRLFIINENIYFCLSFIFICDECVDGDKIYYSNIWINSILIDWYMSMNKAFNYINCIIFKSKFFYIVYIIFKWV